MSWQTEFEPCPLICPWNGTQLCVRHLLSTDGIAEHHLSLAVACGLRHVYHPHGLPPCITAAGNIDWHRTVNHPLNMPGLGPEQQASEVRAAI